MNENTKQIISLCDGIRSMKEIGEIVGVGRRYAGKIARKFGLPQLHRGAQPDQKNHRFVSGRRIGVDGYVLVTAPANHPSARKRTNRNNWSIPEHRLVMEQKLGRYLLPEEVVDHIDGLTLHNLPDNLRLFVRNGEHLQVTTTGIPKNISVSGRQNIRLKYHLPPDFQRIDIYLQRKKRGDVRLLQIFLAALQLGIDSPFLLGTHRHTTKAGIDMSSRSTIELALGSLLQRWEADLSL
jgi:hypothetical protein